MAADKKVLVQSNLRLKADRESMMVQCAQDRFVLERQNLGWLSARQYQGGSWLFKRYQATQFSECDYRSRNAGIFAKSNLSLATPKAMADMHLDKMIDDMLASEKFFAITPEGPEDQNKEALAAAERYLYLRAKPVNLVDKFREALRSCVKRGECVSKATKATIIKQVPVKAKLVLGPDGKPAKDSMGDYITENDVWKQQPDAPEGVMFLERDPKTLLTMPPGMTTPPMSLEQKVFVRPEVALNGCDWDLPYWSDIIIPDSAASVDAADFRCHIFDAYPEDVVNGLPQDRLNKKAVEQYLDQYANNGSGSITQTDATAPAYNRGEQPKVADPDTRTPQKRTFVEFWWRWDVEGNHKSLPLMLLLDLDALWPIAYDYANLVIDWTDQKDHPFGVTRIFPVEKRWYGQGYWEVFSDMNYFIDFCWNTIKIDLAQSGNMLFGNPKATEEGVAGIPYETRGLRMYRTRGQFTPADAMDVKTIASQAAPVNDAMNTALQRLQVLGGNVASGESPVSGMPGKDTATAANLAATQSDVMVRARETEFVKGANPALVDFADIEFADFDPEKAKEMIGDKDAAILGQWIEQHPGDWRNYIEVNMTKTRSAGVIESAMAKLDIIDRWNATPPQLQTKALQKTFADMLRALDDQDPEASLPLPMLDPMTGQPMLALPPEAGGMAPPNPAANVLPPAAQTPVAQAA